MQDQPLFGNVLRDIQLGVKALKEAYPFVRRHRLWIGVLSYGWVSKFLLVIAFVIGLNFLAVLVNWFGSLHPEGPLSYGASLLDLYSGMFKKGYHLFSLGGMKYLILILGEVLIFHAARRTMEVLKGTKEAEPSLKDFMRAQMRMIEISLAAWAFELGVTILISIALGFMHADWLKSPLNWMIQCFFLGAVMVDGYLEKYKLKLTASIYVSRQIAGLALVIGVATYLLLSIPLIGAVIAPFFASIAATLALFEMEVKGWIPLKMKI